MTAYPALIPNKAGWELLARETPDEAKRQGMLLDDRTTPVELIRRDGSSTASFQQNLEDWNDFWSDYKGA